MEQTWHIFKKDIRYLRFEIAFLLLLIALFTWMATHGGAASSLSGVMEPLIVAAVAYTLARLIHAETIPGENQFWITRPYQWSSLLAAKILFAVTFVNLPVLVAQTIILLTFGF